jgi:hypothetical protein
MLQSVLQDVASSLVTMNEIPAPPRPAPNIAPSHTQQFQRFFTYSFFVSLCIFFFFIFMLTFVLIVLFTSKLSVKDHEKI